MTRRVYNNARQYSTASDLKSAIIAVWEKVSRDLLVKLTGSIFDRCLAVVRSKGRKIAYSAALVTVEYQQTARIRPRKAQFSSVLKMLTGSSCMILVLRTPS